MELGKWIGGVIRGANRLARRMASETRGNVAMLFGLTMPVLILMTVGGVDIHRASTVRVNLQDALDASALAAARSPYTAAVDIQRVGLAALKANLKAYPNITLREADTTFVLNASDVVVANSKVDVKTLVANIFLPPYGKFMDDYIPVGAHSEVNRASRNVEVAMVLDITGSMDTGTRLEDMISAAQDLVDEVIQTNQTPYYSKVAVVPYSMAVNPGSSYLAAARGPISTYVDISGAVLNLTGTQRSISAVSKTRPTVITTSANHGFANGDVVWITAVSGISSLNNKAYVVTNKTNTTFELYTTSGSRVDGRDFNNYNGSGKVQKCQNNDCSVTITANNHGLTNNEYVRITDVGGMSALNNKTFLVGNATTNTYTIDPDDTSTLTPYTSGGRSWCAEEGCTFLAFENVNGDLTTHRISNCVTERKGAQAYTEAKPAVTAWLGRHYPNINGDSCVAQTVMPLSSNATTIKNRIGNFQAEGSTAGQIGIGWGWYMLSPSFNTLWPTGAAGAYDPVRTLKAVVIMTDGEFNTPYCRGVVPDNWGTAQAAQRIDCTDDGVPTYEDPFAQSRQMCDAMKAQGIIIYTVGLEIDAGGDAADLLGYCATSSDNFFMPASGAGLSDAFAAIGRDIVQLRISK